MKFQIGTKLGVVSAVGMVLVAAMVINQQISGNAVDAASKRAIAEMQFNVNTLDFKASLRAMLVGVRDMRMAHSIAQLQEASEHLDAAHKSAVGFVDANLALMTTAENRERMTRIKGLTDAYFNASMELKAVINEGLEGQKNRASQATAWDAAFTSTLSTPSLATLGNRGAVEAGLQQVAMLFLRVRVASYRFLLTDEPEMIGRIERDSSAALAKLQETRSRVSDSSLLAEFDELAKRLSEFKTAVDHSVALEGQKVKIVRERTLPAAAAAEKEAVEVDAIVKRLAGAAANEAATSIARAGWIGLGAGIASLLVLLGSAVFGALSIAKPTGRIAAVLLELAGGNKAVSIPFTDRGDEVGDAARAANTFRDNLIRVEKMEAAQREADARALAEQRAAEAREAEEQKAALVRADLSRKEAMHSLADGFESAVGASVGQVSAAATKLETSAISLSKIAETTQQQSTVVASASQEASENVQSVASATEEMTSSVHEIGRQVQEASKIATDAVKQAGDTNARIDQLSKAASRIGDVVKLITSVAEQTNLLALNATIEAARAGEAGRGFAVVAHEVKALAAQTAKATDEISTQITEMQTATQQSVVAIKEIGDTIGRISEISAAIAAAVEEQGAATQEIARNIGEASKGTARVSTNIADVSRGAGQTGSASTEVLTSAQALASECNRLTSEVRKFFDTVRKGPANRREQDDPNYRGPERRADRGPRPFNVAQGAA